jgi:DtxR family Mn-dependent transcriptional regulator
LTENLPVVTQSVEDYLKAIYKLATDTQNVTTSAIASRVRTTPAAVTRMLRHLQKLNLVTYEPYHGARLTEAGEKIALEVIRHHRLLERYLHEALGYDWSEVHEEAERLEHAISEELEERIDRMLGYPSACPHGDPIPAKDGVVAPRAGESLATQHSPAELVIQRVKDSDPALLRYLKERGLLPGTAVTLVEEEPFDGAMVVRVGDREVRVPRGAAAGVFVSAA